MGELLLNNHFTSKILSEERVIHFYASDSELLGSGKSVPFIFLQDGQNLFDRHRNGRTKWGIEETITALRREERIPEMFIIGVEHGPGRAHEYSPTFDHTQNTGGGVGAYLQFLIHELTPYIKQELALQPEPGKTTICGSSLGGLCSLMAWVLEPLFFNYYMILSPSLWWGNGVMFDFIKEKYVTPGEHKIWIDMGVWEWDPGVLEEVQKELLLLGVAPEDVDENIPHPLQKTRRLIDIIEEQGLISPEHFFYYEDPTGRHDEWTWRRRFYDIILYFYGKRDRNPLL